MEHSTPAICILIILLLSPVLYCIRKCRNGTVYYLRKIKGIDEINFSVATSAEQGKPICFTMGMTEVSPLLYACLGILSHVSKICAKVNIPVIVPLRDPESLALIDLTLKSAYEEKGKLHQYDTNRIKYLSSEQLAFASGYQGIVHREKIGTAFLFGSFAAESLILAEAGSQVGARQIAGTVSAEQIPFFITSCDYTLLGEELFAVSAYLTKDKTQLGSLRGQDIAKLVLLVLIIIGTVWETLALHFQYFESGILKNIFSMSW